MPTIVEFWVNGPTGGTPVSAANLHAREQYVLNEATAYTDSHISDASAAHAASAISVTPFSTISATNLQAALQEIVSEGGTGGGTGTAHGYQAPAYSSSFTPAPTTQDEIIKLGVLSGNITVNAVASPVTGNRLTLVFTQDATGGRTVTWNTVYKPISVVSGAPNTRTSFSFFFDGTNWLEI